MGKWLGHVGNRKFIIHRSEATPHHWNWSGYSKFWALLPQLLGWAMHGGPVGQSGNHRVNTASSPGLFPQLALAPSGVAGGFPWQRRHLAPPAAATASRGPETWRSGGWEGFKQQKLRLNWLNQTTCGFSNVWSKTNPRTPSEFAVNTMVLSIFFQVDPLKWMDIMRFMFSLCPAVEAWKHIINSWNWHVSVGSLIHIHLLIYLLSILAVFWWRNVCLGITAFPKDLHGPGLCSLRLSGSDKRKTLWDYPWWSFVLQAFSNIWGHLDISGYCNSGYIWTMLDPVLNTCQGRFVSTNSLRMYPRRI